MKINKKLNDMNIEIDAHGVYMYGALMEPGETEMVEEKKESSIKEIIKKCVSKEPVVRIMLNRQMVIEILASMRNEDNVIVSLHDNNVVVFQNETEFGIIMSMEGDMEVIDILEETK